MQQSRGWFIVGLPAAAPTERYSSAGLSDHGWCPFGPARAVAGRRRVVARIVAAWDGSLAATEALDARSPVAAVAQSARMVVVAETVGRCPVAPLARGVQALVPAKTA